MRTTRQRSTRPQSPAPACEPLEPRKLMAAFASVGISYNATSGGEVDGIAYVTEGDISSSNAATGDLYIAGLGQRSFDRALPYTSITPFADGRFGRNPDAGRFGDPDESNGAQFLSSRGFAAGWWYGNYGQGTTDIEFSVERSTTATSSDLQGTWRFSLITINANSDRYSNTSGTFNISGNSLTWSANVGNAPRNFSSISTINADGRIVTAQTEYFYLSADERTLIFADMNRGDGITYMGAAVRIDTGVTTQTMAGRGYFLPYVFSENNNQPAANAFTVQTYLDLEADGDYRVYNLDDWDSGIRDEPLERGFWSVSNGLLKLEQRDSDQESFLVVSGGGSHLLFITEGDSTPDAITGIGTRAPGGNPTTPQQYVDVGAVDANGRPVVYELGLDNVWRSTDLLTRAGGPAITGSPVTWVDLKDNRLYAAGTSTLGLILYTQALDGTWSFRNLSTEITGAGIITGNVQYMSSPDKQVNLTGLNDQSQLLRFYQNGATSANGAYTWSFVNVSTNDLAPQNQATPPFVGNLTSYSTTWGALNVVGLDSTGNVWSVWWAPGLTLWRADNLTNSIGATPLSGGLTIFQTSWSAINIAGIDSTGEVVVTWWLPSFGGTWRRDSISDAVNGGTSTRFRANSLSSYVTSWGAQNIVGIDDTTGDTRTFWWSPTSNVWNDSSLTAAVPSTAPKLARDTVGIAGRDNSLNVFGYTSDNKYVRYYWLPDGSDRWLSQTVSDIAVPR